MRSALAVLGITLWLGSGAILEGPLTLKDGDRTILELKDGDRVMGPLADTIVEWDDGSSTPLEIVPETDFGVTGPE